MNDILQIALTGGLVGFIEFLIKRHDSKKKEKTVLRSDCQKRREKYEAYFSIDRKDLKRLTQIAEVNTKAIMVLLKNDTVILEHMKTNNATNEIAERQDDTDKFLVELVKTDK